MRSVQAINELEEKELAQPESVEIKAVEASSTETVPTQAHEEKSEKKEKLSKSDQIKNLLVRLYDLRVTMKEVIERYQVVTSGQLSGVILLLEDSQNSLKSSLKLRSKTLNSMTERLDELKLKPKKGRAKDLARIEEIIDRLSDMIVESNE